jgi:pyridoxamine 5'-phosphate oxidase
VPRPEGWSGWRIAPQRIVFWLVRRFGLVVGIEFRRDAPAKTWSKVRLYP